MPATHVLDPDGFAAETPSKKLCRRMATDMTMDDHDGYSSAGLVDSPTEEPRRNALLRPRAYQLEMFEATMRDNVIVSMDTGSGKTQIAILRIQAELEKTSADQCNRVLINPIIRAIDQLVWFLAPTVVLAQQQHTGISKQLTQYQSRLLTGADNIELWSTQAIWDAALLNIRIVVSTPQILLDALSNGFVKMQRLSLIVFDEAHMAMKAAVSNRIMQEFYHPQLREQGTKKGLPHILGLTASPITSKLKQMNDLENNLDARCKTPHLHHEEMVRFVHRPRLELLSYNNSVHSDSLWISMLAQCLFAYDIQDDPDVQWLKTRSETRRKKELLDIIGGKKNPYCKEQLRIFLSRATHLHENLGPWASHRYIYLSMQNLQAFQINEHMIAESWENGRELHLQKILSGLAAIPPPAQEPDKLSLKVEKLIEFLESQYAPGFSGIVFTTQRVAAKMLSDILTLHHRSKNIFQTASVIGDSRNAKRQDRFQLLDAEEQKTAVQFFREHKVNLIVATSVLEEGIDVSACHLVVTFDEIQNLRSFIQRRGRARKSESTFAICLNNCDQERINRFNGMESLMKNIYADEMRKLKEVQDDESIEEDGYDGIFSELGAYLSLANARPRLEHFCATLGHAYTDTRPEFIIRPAGTGYTAKVILTTILRPEFREYEGIESWLTQKMAIRDAAFQACKGLYEAGLLNNRFLPTHKHLMSEQALEPIERRKNLATTSSCQSPWYHVAAAWKETDSYHQIVVEDCSGSGLLPRMLLMLPVSLPCPIRFKIHWNDKTTLTLSLTPTAGIDKSLISGAAEATHLILSSVLSQRLEEDSRDFSCLFLPDIQLLPEVIREWCAASQGHTAATSLDLDDSRSLEGLGLVSQDNLQHRPWVAEELALIEEQQFDADGVPGDIVEVLHIRGTVWPKRNDFTHAVSGEAHTQKKSFPLQKCRIAKLPASYSRFALFVPAIVHNVEIYLHADYLRKTILSPLDIKDLSLLVSAISSPVAREETNYQRLEFLGDAVLKLYASLHLAATKPQWHEGMLTAYKERLVSNHRLSAVAVNKGIDQYILVDAFTALKWRPYYNMKFTEAQDLPERNISTKVLADVIEAIIGAAVVDGGLEKARVSLDFFISGESWLSISGDIKLLHDAVPMSNDIISPGNIEKVQRMIGYDFNKKLLLIEALTHPSSVYCTMPYQRLEFIGDALLDHLITEHVFQHAKGLSTPKMHLLRTTLANGDFLAFLCMKLAIQEERHEIVQEVKKHQVTTKATTHTIRLIQVLRHSSPELGTSQTNTLERFEALQNDIEAALRSANEYPWVALCQLQAPKYMSDVIESLLAAIFIDSHGSWDECRKFLTRLGLTEYLERALSENIELMHPKQRLGEVVDTRKVKYVAFKTDELRFNCTVFVDDQEVTSVTNALSEFEAETLAAHRAISVWVAKGASDTKQESTSVDTPLPN